MDFTMKDIDQEIIRFNYDGNFKEDDFYVSKSNKQIFDLLNKWPKWEKNFLNISGEKFSGKTHLINIFLKKYKGTKIEANLLCDNDLKKIKIFQNIILENVSEKINENLFFTLCNIVEQDNKYLIVTSESSIVNIDFKLNDLKSRTKNFLLQNIE
jgi:chromosomal replication initiation ATPase DnaA